MLFFLNLNIGVAEILHDHFLLGDMQGERFAQTDKGIAYKAS